MAPTISNGKICYLEIPTREVSGSWVVGRPPATDGGLLVYIMVDSVEDAMRAVEDHGGAIVQPIGADAPEITARFTDPYGNLIGLYQEPAPTTSA